LVAPRDLAEGHRTNQRRKVLQSVGALAIVNPLKVCSTGSMRRQGFKEQAKCARLTR